MTYVAVNMITKMPIPNGQNREIWLSKRPNCNPAFEYLLSNQNSTKQQNSARERWGGNKMDTTSNNKSGFASEYSLLRALLR